MKIIIEVNDFSELVDLVNKAKSEPVSEAKPVSLDDLSVEEMGLPTQVANALQNYGIKSYGQLDDLRYDRQVIGEHRGEMVSFSSLKDLRRTIRNFGPTSLEVLKKRMEAIRGY